MSYQGFPNYETWAAVLAVGNSPRYDEVARVSEGDVPKVVRSIFPKGIEGHQPGKMIDMEKIVWRWVAGYVELIKDEEN